jgi:hypothetical protein
LELGDWRSHGLQIIQVAEFEYRGSLANLDMERKR